MNAMTHFTIMNKIFLLGSTVLLMICGVLFYQQQKDHVREFTPQTSLSDFSLKQQEDLGVLHPEARLASTVSGNYLAGMIASIRGDHAQAAHYLTAVINYGDANEPIMALTLRHKILMGDMQGAVVLAREEYKAAHPSRIVTLLLLCDALKRHEMEQARTYMHTLQGAGLHQLFAPFVQEWISYAADPKNYKVSPLSRAMEQSYFASLSAHQRALIFEMQGDSAQAAQAYDLALGQMIDVSDSAVFAALRFYMKQGNNQRARTVLRDYRRVHPRTALWNLAPEERYLEGVDSLHTAHVTNPAEGVAEALLGVGSLLVREGAHDEGQILLRLADYLRPKDLITQLTLGESLEDSDRFREAFALYQQMDAPAWVAPMLTMVKARVHHANDETDRARTLLTELIPQLKGLGVRYNVHVMLGDLERVANHYADAAQHYSHALEALGTPQKMDWPLLYRRGVMYDMAKSWEKAEKDFHAARTLAPDEPEIMNYLAYSWLLRNERVEEAEKMLHAAVQASPNDAHIMDSYGWALYKMGNYDAALVQLEDALMRIPSDPTVNDHYGDVLWRLGRTTEARYYWQRALLFNPTEQGAKEALHAKLKDGLAVNTIHTSDAEHGR
ncbi:MAG: hypothetical protein EAY76_02735 [Alphaproteobacteria bacterium]|nr:MAG: hypothetical protein EAY76_02735 [Alphaproteobacteria bacterium]